MSSESSSSSSSPPLSPKSFGRSNRGGNIHRMLGPDDFWDDRAKQFFAEDEADTAFNAELDPDAHYVDEVDEDFDVDESSAPSEDEEEEGGRRRKKKTVAPPKVIKPKKAETTTTTTTTTRKYQKTRVESSDRVVRTSTKQRTEETKVAEAFAKQTRRKNRKRERRMPTQDEILREADVTERLNIESLHQIRKWEEDEKERRRVKGPDTSGPRVIYHSKGSKTYITFKETKLPNIFETTTQPPPPPQPTHAPTTPQQPPQPPQPPTPQPPQSDESRSGRRIKKKKYDSDFIDYD